MSDRERIENLRIFLGVNKTEFSKILGYTTPQSYTNYLRGANNLSMKMIKAIKKHDNRISLDWILNGQGDMLLGNEQKIINGNSNQKITNNSNDKEVDYLKKEIDYLKQHLKDKDKLIAFLEKSLEEKQK